MSNHTTAKILGAYRRELIEEGLSPDTADDLVRDAAHAAIRGEGAPIVEDEDEAARA